MIYEDSYMVYRSKKRKEQIKENKEAQKDNKPKSAKPEMATKSQWIFRKPKKK